MNPLSNIFNLVFFQPTLNLLVVFYKAFLFLKVPGAFGFAVILLTVVIRLLVHPFFKQQMDLQKKMQDLKPHLDKLNDKHKNDKNKLQQEQMRLYQEAGINPASGCLFLVIQIPVFFALYQTLQRFLLNGSGAKIISQINSELYSASLKIQSINPDFFGFNLALSPAKAHVWYYYLIPLITGLLQYLQVSMTPSMAPAQSPVKADNKKKEGDTSEDFQKAMNTQMKFIFPLMIGYFSYTLPIGLSLYWNIFSLFSIIQYRKIKS